MANFFDKIKKTAGNVSRNTSNQLQTAKLKLKMDSVGKNKAKVFTQLGEVIYNQFKDGAEFQNCEEILDSISSYEDEITKIQEEIDGLNAANKCTSCEKEIEEGTKFCPFCGEEQIIPEEVSEDIDENAVICPDCNTALSEDAKFCNKCGSKIENIQQEDQIPQA